MSNWEHHLFINSIEAADGTDDLPDEFAEVLAGREPQFPDVIDEFEFAQIEALYVFSADGTLLADEPDNYHQQRARGY